MASLSLVYCPAAIWALIQSSCWSVRVMVLRTVDMGEAPEAAHNHTLGVISAHNNANKSGWAGRKKAWGLIGKELDGLMNEMNGELVA